VNVKVKGAEPQQEIINLLEPAALHVNYHRGIAFYNKPLQKIGKREETSTETYNII
jgi:hypothetical protein